MLTNLNAFLLVAFLIIGMGAFTTVVDGQQQTQQPRAPPQQQQNREVSVSIVQGASALTDDAFGPNPVEVSVGDTVTCTNDELQLQLHTVTSGINGQPDGRFDSSPNFNPLLAPGQTFTYTFTEAGLYPYYCAHHPSMVGTVIVS